MRRIRRGCGSCCGDKGLAAGVEGPGVDDESYGLDDESYGLDDGNYGLDDESYDVDDESHSLDAEGRGVGIDALSLEEEEAVPKGQQQAASVVRISMSTPLGLGYGALRRRELALEGDHVYSTFEVGQGYGFAPEPKRSERVSTSRQPTLTTWTDSEDALPTCHVEESEGSGTSGARSTSSDSTAPLSPDHPLTHTTPALVPILRRNAPMAVRVPPVMSPGHSAGIAEVATMSDSAFHK
nr:hypothetical protein [Tanacetum cinerariifolium]